MASRGRGKKLAVVEDDDDITTPTAGGSDDEGPDEVVEYIPDAGPVSGARRMIRTFADEEDDAPPPVGDDEEDLPPAAPARRAQIADEDDDPLPVPRKPAARAVAAPAPVVRPKPSAGKATAAPAAPAPTRMTLVVGVPSGNTPAGEYDGDIVTAAAKKVYAAPNGLNQNKNWRNVASSTHIEPFFFEGAMYNSVGLALVAQKASLVSPELSQSFAVGGSSANAVVREASKSIKLSSTQKDDWETIRSDVLTDIWTARAMQSVALQNVMLATTPATVIEGGVEATEYMKVAAKLASMSDDDIDAQMATFAELKANAVALPAPTPSKKKPAPVADEEADDAVVDPLTKYITAADRGRYTFAHNFEGKKGHPYLLSIYPHDIGTKWSITHRKSNEVVYEGYDATTKGKVLSDVILVMLFDCLYDKVE